MSGVATEQIVIELCHETGEPGLFNNQAMWGKVLDAIRDLSIFNMPSWYMVKLSLNEYNALDWPDSCVTPIMVCLVRNDRRLALDVNNDLINNLNYTDKSADTFELDGEIQDFFRIDGFADAWTPFFNWGLGEIYGLNKDYGEVGSISHNKSRKQSFIKGIQVESDDIYEFYFVGDGLSECPDYVPTECKEAIEYFALAKYFRTRNPNLAALNRENYKQEFYRLQRLYEGDTIEVWRRAMNSNTISAPKT